MALVWRDAERQVTVLRSARRRVLRGVAPVDVEHPYPLAPNPVFRSGKPLLLLTTQRKNELFIPLRWRNGRLERLKMERWVKAVELGDTPYERAGVAVYPLDFPLEELVVASLLFLGREEANLYIYQPMEGAQPPGEQLEESVRKFVEKEYGVKVRFAHLLPTLTGLEPEPARSLVHTGKNEGQLAPVAAPGWLTIVSPEPQACFVSEDGIVWREVEGSSTLTGLEAAYVPENCYFISLTLASATTPPRVASRLGLERWRDCRVVYVPIAWRLPTPKLPEPVRQALLRKATNPRMLEPVDAILSEVGSEWPPTAQLR